MTLGYYESELLRRVDPNHRSLGQYFQDEIAAVLGLDFYIRLPEEFPIRDWQLLSKLTFLWQCSALARLSHYSSRQ